MEPKLDLSGISTIGDEDDHMGGYEFTTNPNDTVTLSSLNYNNTIIGGGFTTGRTALRYGRNFIGFELNKNAYDAFVPTLDEVEVLPDPVPSSPDAAELAKREKMRAGWRNDRLKKKAITA
jgi:hypothetical protein